MTPLLSSIFASIFGLVNIVARSLGGIFSDWSNKKYGMRGRIWALWFWQSVEGVLCILMALVTIDKRAPDDADPLINGWYEIDGEDYQIPPCGALSLKLTDAMKAALGAQVSANYTVWADQGTVVLTEAPSPFVTGSPFGNGDGCISNSDTVGLVVLIMFLFSVAVQMAEGLTFGVVPYVSRPALGVVSGMVGAGGNLGAVIATSIFFKGSAMRTDDGILYLGITILALTMSCFGLYFPESGGMLFKAGAIKYDPQVIKPPADYRGADSMNYDDAIVTPRGENAADVEKVSATGDGAVPPTVEHY